MCRAGLVGLEYVAGVREQYELACGKRPAISREFAAERACRFRRE